MFHYRSEGGSLRQKARQCFIFTWTQQSLFHDCAIRTFQMHTSNTLAWIDSKCFPVHSLLHDLYSKNTDHSVIEISILLQTIIIRLAGGPVTTWKTNSRPQWCLSSWVLLLSPLSLSLYQPLYIFPFLLDSYHLKKKSFFLSVFNGTEPNNILQLKDSWRLFFTINKWAWWINIFHYLL